jgi:predicted permease
LTRRSDADGNRPFAGIARGISDVGTDVRYAVRTWVRQPAFVLVAVVSLACGVGLNTAVFGIINAIFLQSIRGVPDAERVISVGARVPFTTYREIRDTAITLEGVATWQPMGADIRFRDSIVRSVVPAVSNDYFNTLGVLPAHGRFFVPSTSREPAPAAEVVLDYEFWMQTMGGDPDVIGEQILVNRVPATILGIAPRSFHGFGPERPPLWISMGMLPAVRGTRAQWEAPSESGWRIFGRLRTGSSIGQVNAELRTIAARSPDLFPNGPLSGSTSEEGWTGPVSAEKRIEFLLVVVVPLVVAGLILWIGCSNVANLLLARASARRKEIAIRLANGASRSRLVRLLLTESLLLALAGGALGMVLAVWTLDLVWLALPEAPRLAVELDTHVLLYTSLVCVGATLLFGLVPALHATRVDVAPLLKGETPAPHADVRQGARVRRFFLVTQFASSMALLVVAGTFVRAIVAVHVGPHSALVDHLAVAYVEADETSGAGRAAHWRSVRDEILRVPGVSSVTLSPPGSGARLPMIPEGAGSSTARYQVQVQRIDARFFQTVGVVVVTGRSDLARLPRSVMEQTVVNERAARQFWGGTDVLGRRFSLGEPAVFQVAGIVRDDEQEPRVFRALGDEDLVAANILIRTSASSVRLIEPLRSVLSNMGRDPAFVRVTTLRDASMGPLGRIAWMSLVIAALVLSLATVGLYGSISFVTSQRTREIAIRMAIGAPAPAVLRLVAREGVLVVSIGSALGLALIGMAFRFMSGMIFATWTLEPVTIAGVVVVFALATLGACYLPGRRATRLDPMSVLRSD